MALTAKAAAQIGKLLDLHYCPGDDLEETARLQGKAENARALIDYLKATGMSNFNKLFFRTQASVMFWVEFQDSYRAIDLNVVAQHKNIIQRETESWARVKQYAVAENFETHFLSIDISSANFTTLTEICDLTKSWPEFVRPHLPEANILQPEFSAPVPECLIASKYFRLFVLGKLAKLQPLWELRLLRLYQRVQVLLRNEKPALVWLNTDELVLSVDSAEAGHALAERIAAKKPFKSSVFQLEAVDTSELKEVPGCHHTENYCCKRYTDGRWRLTNVHPPHFNQLYVRYSQ